MTKHGLDISFCAMNGLGTEIRVSDYTVRVSEYAVCVSEYTYIQSVCQSIESEYAVCVSEYTVLVFEYAESNKE